MEVEEDLAVEGVGAEGETTKMENVLEHAGIVVKKVTWLTNVKNHEEKEKTQEVL